MIALLKFQYLYTSYYLLFYIECDYLSINDNIWNETFITPYNIHNCIHRVFIPCMIFTKTVITVHAVEVFCKRFDTLG